MGREIRYIFSYMCMQNCWFLVYEYVVSKVLLQYLITEENSFYTFVKWTVGSSCLKGTTKCLNVII